MKTPDEIKSMLNCCATSSCDCCPYYGADDYDECTGAMAETALDYIQQLEREREALAALYKPHSTCDSCKHNGSKLCDNCTNKDNRWEWAGIKEDNP